MTEQKKRLQELREKVSRFHQLSSVLRELRMQKSDLTARVRELENIKLNEQSDVDRLEGRSLAAFYYNVIGKLDEQLTRERQEAYAAAVKYDAAARELAQVEDEIRRCEEEFHSLRDCERQYWEAFREKAAAIKAAGGANAEELLKLEEQVAILKSRQKELREAIEAGRSALGTASGVLKSLDSAEGWGMYDIMGGGMVADIAKHSHLDEAQSAVETLQSQLRRFKTDHDPGGYGDRRGRFPAVC